MSDHTSHGPLTLAAIDIETAPDPQALDSLAGRDGGRRGVALHLISAAAWLVMSEDAAGRWSVLELASKGAPDEEFEILLSLNEVMRILLDADGELVTYNGSRHDVPVIRRRASRHWMFGQDGLFPPSPIRHRDVMRSAGLGIGDWPTLRETCAGLGFSCDAEQEPTGCGRTLTPRRRKAETDAVAAMIIRLHELAAERRRPETLAHGWAALSRQILRKPALRPHLVQFTTSPDLAAAVGRFGAG